MTVQVSQNHLEPEVFGIDVDYTPAVKALLWDEANKRPHKLWAYVYDDPIAGTLLYPPLEVFGIDGDEDGLHIDGLGILHCLGTGGVGPTIVYREYVSGADKLSNGGFDLDDLYWRRISEGSQWRFSAGLARNGGGLRNDDVLEYDRKFPTQPGNEYRAVMEGVSGTGRLRLRTLYEGRFNPTDLLYNGDFEDATGWTTTANVTLVTGGQRTGTRSMQIGQIPKPQLVTNSGFDSGSAGWSAATGIVFTGSACIGAPIPYPDLLLGDGGFESGTGWTLPAAGDIAIETTAQARSGSNAMRVGPIVQKELLKNPTMATGLDYWFMSSEVAEPDPGLYYWHSTDGVDNGPGATTDGGAPSARQFRYLRADYILGGGVDEHPVTAGEQYELEVYARKALGSGYAKASIAIPHPTVANRQRWYSDRVDADELDDNEHRLLRVPFNIPNNRPELNVVLEVRDHISGYWTFSQPRVTRVRGNRSKATRNSVAIVANSTYRLSCRMRSHDEFQVGDVVLGVKLSGAGVDNDPQEVRQGHTDSDWVLVKVDFTPQDDYTTAEPYIVGEDIVGYPMWVDEMRLEKTSNNYRQTNHDPFAIVAGQRYQLAAAVQSGFYQTRGEMRVGVVLSGAGVTDVDVAIDQSDTEGKVLRLAQDFTPEDGYTTATPYIRFKDLEGDSSYVYYVTVTKMDNNTDAATGTQMVVIPERTYRWLQAVRSGANLQRGTVKLSVTCEREGYGDVVFDSSPMEGTAGEWKFIDFSFTPPSGYHLVTPRIIGIDVEGDLFNLDDGEIRDTDSTTYVLNTWLTSPSNGTATMETTAPEGAESVRVQLAAEAGSANWSVNTVKLIRTDGTPATGEDIVEDLLVHPKTGNPLPIAGGTITAPLTLPADWVIANMTNRDALDHLCNVTYPSVLEYRVLASDPPAIDVGPAADVCTTHPMADALLPEDRDVTDLSNPVTDTSERPTEVRVLGAEVEMVSGQTFLIEATAQVPGSVEYDLAGNPIVRTKTVQGGTVDHVDYAVALSTDHAAREAAPALAVSVKLSGKGTRPFKNGDTVYVYHPESGLADPANSVVIEGKTVFPRACRVLGDQRVHGPSHRIVMRRPDGTEFPLPGVRWAGEDATTLTIGDRLPDWQVDPQGKATGDQYLADRARRPR